MEVSLRQRLMAAGLSERLSERLSALSRKAVRFVTEPEPDASRPAVGVSRLGGSPDLREGFAWPAWRDRPLAFICQLNLADVSGFPCCAPLPEGGLLTFFYDREQETWGFDPKDRGSWLVHYEPDLTGLRRTEAGAESSCTPFAPCSLSPVEALTLAEADSLAAEELDLSPADRVTYYDTLEGGDEDSPGAPKHQLLGHPSALQGEMQLQCQLVTNGLYCGDPSGYEDPRAASLRAGATQWQLLLQIDSDDQAEMMWGDCGRLYFWLTEEALRRRAFSEAWMVLQCS